MRVGERVALWSKGWVLATVLAVQGCGGNAEQPPAAAASPAPATPAAPVTTDLLLGWAEATWPDLFPAGPATQALQYGGVDYAVRLYAGTGNITGVAADGGVWGFGPFTGNQLKGFGAISDFTCLVAPERCPVVNPPCTTTVASGFAGDLNAVYDAGGDGSADGDGGSAGVGGSEGKVLGARLRVYRLADGALLGEGTTDPVQGLATVKWCKSDLPVLVEMQGAPGASYYDEALDSLVPFPVDQTLHGLVDRFDENIGVSSLTEAAYQYALATYAPSMVLRAPGRARALAASGVPRGLTAEQVRAANGRMLAELNRRFTDRLQQRSVKALATPIDQRSTDGALPRNRYGRLAALTGGFAKVARSYNPSASAPALTFAQQLALDMTDGLIDDHAANGLPVAGTGQATYKSTEAGINWTLGASALGQRFGSASTLLDGDPYVAVQFVWLAFDPACRNGHGETRLGNYYLSTIGTLTLGDNRAPAGGCIWDAGTTTRYQVNIVSGIRKLSGTAGGDRAFAITDDGRVLGWGWNLCGRVGNGVVSDTLSDTPTVVQGLSGVVDVLATSGLNVALTARGEVFVWGPNTNNLLRTPESASDPECSDLLRGYDPPLHPTVRVITAPRRLAALSDITAISGSGRFINAVGADGRVFQWGYVADDEGRVTLQSTPKELRAVGPVRKVTSNESMSFAIVAGGRVATWWVDPIEIFDGEAASQLKAPQVLRNVSNVVDLVSDPVGVTLALRADGGMYLWGRWSTTGGYLATPPRPASDVPVRRGGALVPGGLPRIVRLTIVANFAAAIGADNVNYVFRPGATLATSYWDATPSFSGVPSPY